MVSSRSSGLTGVNNDDATDTNRDNNANAINKNNNNNQRQDTSATPLNSSSKSTPEIQLRANDKDAILSFNGPKKNRRTDSLSNEQKHLFSNNQTQSGPSSLSSSNVQPNTIANVDFPDEESYEGFGYAQNSLGVEQNLEIELETGGSSAGDSNSSAPSPTGPNSLSL